MTSLSTKAVGIASTSKRLDDMAAVMATGLWFHQGDKQEVCYLKFLEV